MSTKEVIRKLLDDGWEEVLPRTPGSHRQFRHFLKKGRVTVKYPQKDIPLPTLKRIEQQSSLKLR